jgi:hypothetical protein
MAKPPENSWRADLPAWPLGCAIALLGLLLMVTLLGLSGILFASAGLPPWLERGGPVAVGLSVPLLMLVGWAVGRRRNPYGARALLWGFLLTLALGTALTLLFNLIDRLNGMG